MATWIPGDIGPRPPPFETDSALLARTILGFDVTLDDWTMQHSLGLPVRAGKIQATIKLRSW